MHPVEDREATTQVTPDRVHHIKTAMEKEKPSALWTVTPHVLTHVWTAPMGGVCNSTATGTDTIAAYAIGRYPIGHMHYTRRWVEECVYTCIYIYMYISGMWWDY